MQSCRSESWITTANEIKQLSGLLRSNHIKDIGQVFTIVLKPHLDKFGKFIKKVAVFEGGKNEGSMLLEKRVNGQVKCSC